jgi:glycosyltransferase involved in cell wall biosynthesis
MGERRTSRSVVVFGPETGGVGDSFSQTVAHLSKASEWQVSIERVPEATVPSRGAAAVMHRYRRHLRAADVVHVEFGSNDMTLFWLALLMTLRRRTVAVVIHDFPLLVNHPAAGMLSCSKRWKSIVGYRVLSPLLDRLLKRLLLHRAGMVAVMSEDARAGWSKLVSGELLAIPHGSFPRSDAAVPPSRAHYVLFAGFMGPSKGVDVLLDAWEQVSVRSERELVIAGASGSAPDPELERMKRRSETWVKPPRWVGFVESERELEDLIAQAAVVVLPYRRSSPASGILVRSMLEGRAIVATHIPAAEQTLRNQVDGLLVRPGEAGCLAKALEEMLSDPAERDRLGTSARERADSLFSSTKQCELLLGAYEHLRQTPQSTNAQSERKCA